MDMQKPTAVRAEKFSPFVLWLFIVVFAHRKTSNFIAKFPETEKEQN
jgi:hypothetical protein